MPIGTWEIAVSTSETRKERAGDPYVSCKEAELYHGDALDCLRKLPDASVAALVTDPPRGIGFMGTSWDKD